MASSIFADDGYTYVKVDSATRLFRIKRANLNKYLNIYGSDWKSVNFMILNDNTKYTFDGSEIKCQFDSLLSKCACVCFIPLKNKDYFIEPFS